MDLAVTALVPMALRVADLVDPVDLLVVVLVHGAACPVDLLVVVLMVEALAVNDAGRMVLLLAALTEFVVLAVPTALAVVLPDGAIVLVSRGAAEELSSGSMRLTASSTKFSARFPL